MYIYLFLIKRSSFLVQLSDICDVDGQEGDGGSLQVQALPGENLF